MAWKVFEKNVLGIDFRDNSIIAVILKKGVTGFQLTASINIPFNGTGANDDTVSDFKKFLTQQAIEVKNVSVSVSVPKEWGLIKFLDIPSPDRDTLRDVMRYEIERHIPFDVDAILYDFQIVAEKPNTFNVMLVIIQKDKISYIKDFLDKIPLKLDNVSISTLNNLNALELSGYNTNLMTELSGIDRRPDVFGYKNSLCVSIYTNSFGYEIAVIKNGYCISLNTVSVEFKTSEDTILKALVNETTKTIAGFNGKKPVRIVLAGHAVSELKNLMTEVSERIHVVEKLSCFTANIKDQSINNILSATGACYLLFGLGGIQINLLPVKGNRNKKAGATIAKISFAVIIILLCALAARKISSERILLKTIEKEISDKKPDIMQIEKMSSDLAIADKKINFLKRIKKGKSIELDMLAELSKILPENVWLSGLKYTKKINSKDRDGSEVIMSGFAKSYSNLIPVIEDSKYFENAKFVKPITKSIFGEAFEIKASVVIPGRKNQEQNR
ncbi:MAG: pilus assembly protein PilM [Proteobacteria bacterium]|nr:pilus assembly protein PilM [Pseudomonadota bacterium]